MDGYPNRLDNAIWLSLSLHQNTELGCKHGSGHHSGVLWDA